MKHITTLLVAFLLFARLHAQDQDAIAKETKIYSELLVSQDFDKSLDLVYPKLFEIVPRVQMEEALKKTMNNGVFTIRLNDFKLSKISNTIEKDTIKYALVTYSQKMSMHFFKQPDKTLSDKMLTSLQEKYGKGNVSFDKATRTFIVTYNTSMYAINDPEYGGWKFLENKEEMNKLIPGIIPAEISEALNK